MTRDERAQLIAAQKRVETLAHELRAIRDLIAYTPPDHPSETISLIAARVSRALAELPTGMGNRHAP